MKFLNTLFLGLTALLYLSSPITASPLVNPAPAPAPVPLPIPEDSTAIDTIVVTPKPAKKVPFPIHDLGYDDNPAADTSPSDLVTISSRIGSNRSRHCYQSGTTAPRDLIRWTIDDCCNILQNTYLPPNHFVTWKIVDNPFEYLCFLRSYNTGYTIQNAECRGMLTYMADCQYKHWNWATAGGSGVFNGIPGGIHARWDIGRVEKPDQFD